MWFVPLVLLFTQEITINAIPLTMSYSAQTNPLEGTNEVSPDWVGLVRHKVEAISFGVVQLVIHDGRVTQIEVTEKTRIDGRHQSRPQA